MSALFWSPATLYAPGSVVRPLSNAPPAAAPVLQNPSFESGLTGWAVTGAFTHSTAPGAFMGTGTIRITGPTANSSAISITQYPVVPGQIVTARCQIAVFNANDQVGGACVIVWYTAGGAVISTSEGNQVNVLNRGWTQSAVTGTAPATAAYCRVGVFAFALQPGVVSVDAFSVDYVSPAGTSQLVYRATQPAAALSASTEPAWPAVAGVTVNDGGVVWEGFEANVVVWEAEPILVSGNTEPVWPRDPGASVLDGAIAWVCTGRQIKDARCPHTKAVAITASKVFAGAGDVIRYSATGNPLDWSSAEDAGFLPFGLQQNGANQIDVLNLYRSNLVAFNASTFQMWQVDADPEQMALLDTLEGIGSVAHKAAQPVANDLFFLTALGVRTVGIAGGSTNLQAGDVGMPIDSLVQQSVITAAQAGIDPLSCYYPAAGQYWLMLPTQPPPPLLPALSIATAAGCFVGGQPFTFQYAAQGGVPPYTWTLVNAPVGWTLSATGLLAGTAPVAEHEWRVRVSDSAGQVAESTTVCDGGYSLTSMLYPIEVIEGLSNSGVVLDGTLRTPPVVGNYIEGLSNSGAVLGGELRNLLQSYSYTETLSNSGVVLGGELRTVLVNYVNYPPETLSNSGLVLSGELRTVLINYANYPPEGLSNSGLVLGGTLS